MEQCVSCGAIFINEEKLIKTKEEEFDLFPKKETLNIPIEYYICPKCGYENHVNAATNQ
jgi:DNA-directed RNA polymerase subunit M/transcription elongation factor TFIIS